MNEITHSLRGEGFDASEDGTGRGTPLIPVPHVDCLPTMMNGANTAAAHNARSGHTKDSYIVPMAFAQNTRDKVRLINGDGQIAGALAAEPGMKQQTYCAVQPTSTYGIDNENNGFPVDGPCGPLMKDSPTGGVRPLPAVMTAMQVRRLTPVECERLQGFPPVLEILRIEGCIDHQNKSVRVEASCHRLQSSAWTAAESEYLQFANTVALGSNISQVCQGRHVAVYARQRCAGSLRVLLKNQSVCDSSASSAGKQNWSLSHIQSESFAALLAPHWESLGKTVIHGKEASPQNILLSSMVESGNRSAVTSGAENEVSVSGAETGANEERCITSPLGRVMPTCDSPIATSLCSVINATSSFIQNETLPENFCIDLVLERGYTDIKPKGKPTPDGPRYKALGNSMAVPVMAHIGRKIQEAVK
jgi:hypothetical protein